MKNRGFTLIELLVVIAVIGLLAAVILASLNSARDKGKIASIKSNLKNLGSQAELYYDNHNTYAGLCTPDNATIDPSITPFIDELKSIAGPTYVKCFVHAAGVTNYRAADAMETRNFAIAVIFNDVRYAVDNIGVVTFDTANNTSQGTSTTLANAQTACANVGKRLPSMEQLKALYNISGSAGFTTGTTGYWSGSPSPSTPNVYAVFFASGIIDYRATTTNGYVRCVS